jgi:hypothetical protein
MAKNKITYMKLLENIKLNDGTVVDKGTSIRMNYKEGPFLNVEINEGQNVKKIFWITEEQAKTSIVRNHIWTKKNFEEHIKDLKESWFEKDNNENKKVLLVDSLPDSISKENTTAKKRGRPKKIK